MNRVALSLNRRDSLGRRSLAPRADVGEARFVRRYSLQEIDADDVPFIVCGAER
jgi:hypothetical protein